MSLFGFILTSVIVLFFMIVNSSSISNYHSLMGLRNGENIILKFRDDNDYSLDDIRICSLIKACISSDEVFRYTEEIPAVKSCVDKFLKITQSTSVDAKLAVDAIFRLSIIMQSESKLKTKNLIDDRRFEQLIECVELQFSNMPVSELIKYIWSLCTLQIDDDIPIREYLLEVSRRVENWTNNDELLPNCDNLIALFWSLGCVKETYELSNTTSTQQITNLIKKSVINNPIEFQSISIDLMIRLLWTTAVNHISSDSLKEIIFENIGKKISSLSCSNITTVLWSTSILKIENNTPLHEESLKTMLQSLQSEDFANQEIPLVIQALLEHRSFINTCGRKVLRDDTDNVNAYNSLLKNSDKCVNSLTSICCDRLESLPFSMCIELSQLRSKCKNIGESPESWVLWHHILTQLENIVHHAKPKESTIMNIPDISSLLESISLQLKKIRFRKIEGVDSKTSSSSNPTGLSRTASAPAEVTRDPFHRSIIHRWNYLLGRLSAQCSLRCKETFDKKSTLLNACWALSTLGYPYRSLLRAVRRNVQFSLHELSADNLARLVVCLATEEMQSSGRCRFSSHKVVSLPRFSWSNGKITAKLDREFEDQVVISIFKRASEISSTDDLIDALVAAAALGRLISYRCNFASYVGAVDISTHELQHLGSYRLIQLLWAQGRLPEGILSVSTIAALQQVLSVRGLDPAVNSDVSYDDLLLYVRNLFDSHCSMSSASSASSSAGKKKAVMDGNAVRACKVLTSSLLQYFDEGDCVDEAKANARLETTAKLEHVLRTESSNIAYLADIAQSFHEVEWHNDEAGRLFRRACTKFRGVSTATSIDAGNERISSSGSNVEVVDDVSSSGLHVLHSTKYFNLGKLEELATSYEVLCSKHKKKFLGSEMFGNF